ncbi:unnamed protein product [Dovyalis caffra]|uniref:Uncharacterized protein n=1 Tax=Dovyalis caffra TaxID=77055 RepID=A0AAV1RP61_9ROSI|nr:unnamed protein product [Dovyalis caffra]
MMEGWKDIQQSKNDGEMKLWERQDTREDLFENVGVTQPFLRSIPSISPGSFGQREGKDGGSIVGFDTNAA